MLPPNCGVTPPVLPGGSRRLALPPELPPTIEGTIGKKGRAVLPVLPTFHFVADSVLPIAQTYKGRSAG